MTEVPLPGGLVHHVVRAGDTVRRPAPERTDYVTTVLKLLEAQGWSGAPRHLGFDGEGRQVLEYMRGHVAWQAEQPDDVYADESLAAVARLVRQFHDLTAGTPPAGSAEVVCHNDLAPKNTVYRQTGSGLRPAGFIDWDLAAPGRRIHDVAHVCWQYLHLGPGTDAAEAGRRMRLIADAYGLTGRDELVTSVLWWQDRCWRGIADAADRGESAMVRLREAGVVDEIQAAYRWTVRNQAVLAHLL
ncbi:phosphotransferase [Streptomyces sp. NPDC006422]|uniref:phosphotransferase n=1 Tax=unclassified Streptomyces TaxID=2593676 RepID=UPI00339EE843